LLKELRYTDEKSFMLGFGVTYLIYTVWSRRFWWEKL